MDIAKYVLVACVVVMFPVMVRLPTKVEDAVERNPPDRVARLVTESPPAPVNDPPPCTVRPLARVVVATTENTSVELSPTKKEPSTPPVLARVVDAEMVRKSVPASPMKKSPYTPAAFLMVVEALRVS